MRKKIGTFLDEELLWEAKKTAAETKKSFSQLLEEALKEIMEEEGVYET